MESSRSSTQLRWTVPLLLHFFSCRDAKIQKHVARRGSVQKAMNFSTNSQKHQIRPSGTLFRDCSEHKNRPLRVIQRTSSNKTFSRSFATFYCDFATLVFVFEPWKFFGFGLDQKITMRAKYLSQNGNQKVNPCSRQAGQNCGQKTIRILRYLSDWPPIFAV